MVVLHRENVEAALRKFGVAVEAVSDEDLTGLARAWRWLPPWPDSVPGIAAMKQWVIVGPLSNGDTRLLVDMAKYARLPWDVIMGSDTGQAYKPDPAAYLTPGRLLGLEPGEVMLVAAHNADLKAARDCGLSRAPTRRPTSHRRPGGACQVQH